MVLYQQSQMNMYVNVCYYIHVSSPFVHIENLYTQRKVVLSEEFFSSKIIRSPCCFPRGFPFDKSSYATLKAPIDIMIKVRYLEAIKFVSISATITSSDSKILIEFSIAIMIPRTKSLSVHFILVSFNFVFK